MEFIESFKLTDIARVEAEGLDRKDLAKRVADTFLYQIVYALRQLRGTRGILRDAAKCPT